MKRYRVIQWATGEVGKAALRGLIRRPEFELAGLWVSNPEKVGRDAADLAGLEGCMGIRATADKAALLAVDADCVLYCARADPALGAEPQYRELCDILASGKNVVSVFGGLFPKGRQEAILRDLEDAARSGGTTLLMTGINPGFVGERLAILATSLCTDISKILFRESVDLSDHQSTAQILGLMNFGKDTKVFDDEHSPYRELWDHNYRQLLTRVGGLAGLTFDSIRTELEFGLARRALTIAAGPIPKGSIAAQRWRWSGVIGGQDRMVLETNYVVDRELPDWEIARGWTVVIEGEPSVKLVLSIDASFEPDRELAAHGTEGYVRPISAATAAPALNAIPYVCAAEGGVIFAVPQLAAFQFEGVSASAA